ncbi:hypothetical protein MKZ38_000886 [Zalerion maritima]|uniref:Thioredoxin n=1 Tax=Zalerion maritima TaxID=339359 RepID=A0AAD5S5M6_9PEZI|nr:hypothetical protein MKZ38_000886 [Zalerion maritima]
MDVQLLVYDLSHGLARQMSMGMLGFQLDAVYHTSILIEGLEYVYQQSIRVVQPGAFSGFGTPIEKIHLGKTQLPHEVIIDYLNSVKDRFTPDAYSLFTHNCNTFTDEFSSFLVGKGIPEHITNMPQAVLDTPFGGMLQRQLGGMFPVGDPLPESGSEMPSAVSLPPAGAVREAGALNELDALLTSAKSTFAVIFFTSRTCPPCKMLYPLYDELAQEVGDKGVLIKVDTSQASNAADCFSIRATPTFITFLRGEQESQWSGVDAGRLKETVHMLVQRAHNSHPHESLKLPNFFAQSTEPAFYLKVPPLTKLTAKLGTFGTDPAVLSVKEFVESIPESKAPESSRTVLGPFSHFVVRCLNEVPIDVVFAVVDLLRCALIKPGAAEYILTNEADTVQAVLDFVNSQKECPYALRLVTLHMACNLAKSSHYADKVLGQEDLRRHTTKLITSSLLDEAHRSVRISAATLLLNVALVNNKPRRDGDHDMVPEDDQVELAASVLEAVSREESSEEALRGLILAMGFLLYLAPPGGEMSDLLAALDAKSTMLAKKSRFPNEKFIPEVVQLLEGLGMNGS